MGGQAQIDAVVSDQFLRRPWRRPLREIRRSSHDRHAHVRPDTHCDHVLRHLLAEPHASVITLGDDVGQAIVDDDLDLDTLDIPAGVSLPLARGPYRLHNRWP
jgi:hypothetical protein